jgi:hypothetical protein
MVRRALFTAVGVLATLALFMGPAAATSEPVTKITFTLDAASVHAGADVTGLVEVTTGSGKAETPFGNATLSVWVDGVQVGSAVTNGAGVASVSQTATVPGMHSMRVLFAGDAQHKKAHRDETFVVTAGSPTSPPPTTTATTTTVTTTGTTTTPPYPTTTTTATTTTAPPEPTTTTTEPTTTTTDPTTTTTAPPEPTTTPTTTTTPPPTGQAPDAPVIYLFEAPAPGLNYLEWTIPVDNGSEITGYNVYRRVPGGTMDFLLHKGASAFSADDIHVTSGVTYAYVVTAVNAIGESAWSNEVSLTAI